MKKMIGIIVLTIMLLSILIPSISLATTEEIIINDNQLKELIVLMVDSNKDGIITEEEMKNLESIQIPEGVTDLTGLEYAINLKVINVPYSENMPDLSKINSESNKEVYVNVSNATTLVNLDFLKNVKNLIDVMIFKPDKEEPVNIDYSVLAQIKTLKSLSLRYGVAPKSMEDLGKLTNLKELDIMMDGIGTIDLKGIENFPNLTSLEITDYNLQNASKLGELKHLNNIHFYGIGGISDLSALANCNELEYVTIISSDLSDISFLKNKENLKNLTIQHLPIKDISVISTLKNLEQLDIIIDGEKVEGLNAISSLKNLKKLYLDVNGEKIEGLEEYKNKYEKTTETANNGKIEETETQDKKETKANPEKPTRIPQAGINVIECVILGLIAMMVIVFAVVFVKTKRK